MEIILGIILALTVFLLANVLYKVTNRPKIVPINPGERTAEALVVIDMQEDFTRQTGKMAHDPDKLEIAIDRINELASKAHEMGMPVLEVSHSFVDPFEKFAIKLLAGGAGLEGSDGLKRDEALTFQANAQFRKHEGDSFTSEMFRRFLEEHKIGHLYLTGQDANACINATAKGALRRKYKVTLLDDAILARNETSWTGKRAKLIGNGAVTGDGLSAT